MKRAASNVSNKIAEMTVIPFWRVPLQIPQDSTSS